jgi:hypothetical protein
MTGVSILYEQCKRVVTTYLTLYVSFQKIPSANICQKKARSTLKLEPL